MTERILVNLSMAVKTTLSNGELRWKSTISTDEVDLAGERLDVTLYDELVKNFEAWKKGDTTPPVLAELKSLGWTGTMLEPAHFSLYLDSAEREKVRVGTVDRLYRDGRYLKAQGTFDDTEIGRAAFHRSIRSEDPVQTSICFCPDPSCVVYEGDVKVYKGGSGRAFMDHVALTVVPMNTGTDFEAITKSAVIASVEDDVAEVLGQDVAEKVLALKKSKRQRPKSTVVKASIGDTVALPTADPNNTTVGDTMSEPVDTAAVTPAPAETPATEAPAAPVETPAVQSVVQTAPVAAPAPAPASFADVLGQLDANAARLFGGWQQPANPVPQPAPVQMPQYVQPALPIPQMQAVPVSQPAQQTPPAPAQPDNRTVTLTIDDLLKFQELTARSAIATFVALSQATQPVRRSLAPGGIPASQIVTQQPVAKSNPETMSDVVKALESQNAARLGLAPVNGNWNG